MSFPPDMLHAAEARTLGFQNHANEAIKIQNKLQNKIASIKQKLALNNKKIQSSVNSDRLRQQLTQKLQEIIFKDSRIRALEREVEQLKTKHRINKIMSKTAKIEISALHQIDNPRSPQPETKQKKHNISQIYHIPDKLQEEVSQLKEIQQKASLLKNKQKRERMIIKRLNSNTKRSTDSIPYGVINQHDYISESQRSGQQMSNSYHSQDYQSRDFLQNHSMHSNPNQDNKRRIKFKSSQIDDIKSQKSLNNEQQKIENGVEEKKRQTQVLKNQCEKLLLENNDLKVKLEQQKSNNLSTAEIIQKQLAEIKHQLKEKTQECNSMNREMQSKFIEQSILNKKIINLQEDLQKQLLFCKQLQQEARNQAQLVCQKTDLNFELSQKLQNLKYQSKLEDLKTNQIKRYIQVYQEENSRLTQQNNQIKSIINDLKNDLLLMEEQIKKQQQKNRILNQQIDFGRKKHQMEICQIQKLNNLRIGELQQGIYLAKCHIRQLEQNNRALEEQREKSFYELQRVKSQKNRNLTDKQYQLRGQNKKIYTLQKGNKQMSKYVDNLRNEIQRNIMYMQKMKLEEDVYIDERNRAMRQKQELSFEYLKLLDEMKKLSESLSELNHLRSTNQRITKQLEEEVQRTRSHNQQIKIKEEVIEGLKRQIQMTTNSYQNIVKMKEQEQNQKNIEHQIQMESQRHQIEKMKEILQKNKAVQQEKQMINQQLVQLRKEFQELKSNHHQTLTRKLQQFQAQKESLKTQNTQINQNIQNIQQSLQEQNLAYNKCLQQTKIYKLEIHLLQSLIISYQSQLLNLQLKLSQLQRQYSLQHTLIQSLNQSINNLKFVQNQNLILKYSLSQKTTLILQLTSYKQSSQAKIIEFQNTLKEVRQTSQIKQMIADQTILQKEKQIIQLNKKLFDKQAQISMLSQKFKKYIKSFQKNSRDFFEVQIHKPKFIESQKLIEQQLQKSRRQFRVLNPRVLAKSQHGSSSHHLPLILQTPIKQIEQQLQLQQKPQYDRHRNILYTNMKQLLSQSEQSDILEEMQHLKSQSKIFGAYSQCGNLLATSIVSSTSNKSAIESQKQYQNKMKQNKLNAKLKRKK